MENEKKLIGVLILSIKDLHIANTKYGTRGVATINFHGIPQQELWVSPKQYDNLTHLFDFLNKGKGYSTNVREAHCVLEETEKGYRYIWGGIHTAKKSDLKYLEDRFGVKFEYTNIPRIDLELEKPVEVADELKDE